MTVRRALPLALWAGLLSTAPVLVAAAVVAGVLSATGRLDLRATEALAVGASAGLGLSLVSVLAAARLAAGLQALRDDTVARLQQPGAPLAGPRPVVTRASLELAELARVLDALHLRVRLGDEVGQRHRREAENAGAGVFELLSGLVAAEEGARGQLAAELHDTVAQSLIIARNLLTARPRTAAELERLSDHVADAEEQVRAVMARTRPPVLRDGDLAGAVDALRADLHARYALDVRVLWPEQPHALPVATAVTVYRFFQEALLNVVKHADVDTAVLSLEVDSTAVRACVSDDGPGFDLSQVVPSGGRHVGLGLLRERARLAGGVLDVASEEGAGATLTLRLPRPPVPDGVPDSVLRPRGGTVPPLREAAGW